MFAETIWLIVGFCTGAAGFYLAIRHFQSDGTFENRTDFLKTVVPTATFVGLFTTFLSGMSVHMMNDKGWGFKTTLGVVLNLSFLVAPEAIVVIGRGSQNRKKK